VDASFEVGTDVTLASLHPHMHGRGKDFEYAQCSPPAKQRCFSRCLVRLALANWYNTRDAAAAAEGTRIDCIAHFDNSPDNPEAADPRRE
jgi:hypothetical protein